MKRKKRKNARQIIALATIFTVLCTVVILNTVFAAAGIKVTTPGLGEEIADFKVQTIDGKDISISAFKGKKVFVNLWKTDCLGCVEELPAVFAAAKDTKIEVMAVCGIDTAEVVKKFCNAKGFDTSKVYLDREAKLLAKFGFQSYPDSIFIDASGKISSKVEGQMTKDQMLSEIAKIPNGAPTPIPSRTPTPSPSVSPSVIPTVTLTATPSPLPSISPSPNPSPSNSPTPTPTVSPTPGPQPDNMPSNVAKGKPVKASSQAKGYRASYANDFKFKTQWRAAGSGKQWIQLDLKKSYDLSYIIVIGRSYRFNSYTISYSADGKTWSRYSARNSGAKISSDNYIERPLKYKKPVGRYVRITFNSAMFWNLFSSTPGIREIIIFSIPNNNPDPSPSPSPQPSVTPSPSNTVTPTPTANPTATLTPTATPQPSPTSTPGGKFPDNLQFELNDLAGKKVSLNDFYGRKIFINFWATWCGYCTKEMPDMEKIHKEYGDNLVILAVNAGETSDTVKSFISKNGYTFSILFDTSRSVCSKYGVSGYPTSVFIDTKGTVKHNSSGAMSYENMKKQIDALN